MADPEEGITAGGAIRTGVDRSRVPVVFEPVLSDAIALLGDGTASLYLYGSVATGRARVGASDVDLLSIGLRDPAALGEHLSTRYADLCRGVEIAATTAEDFEGDSDSAYGNRVFLRHYCVHLAGPDLSDRLPDFPADARAARGFNGDLGQWLRRWRTILEADPAAANRLGVRIARKTLLAVAGLVSVHDHTWTTDRARAAQRWSEVEPDLAAGLGRLHGWAARQSVPEHDEVEDALAHDGVVTVVVERFRSMIGLWQE